MGLRVQHNYTANIDGGCWMLSCAQSHIYRPSFRENKPKTLVFNDWKRASVLGLFLRKLDLYIQALVSESGAKAAPLLYWE